MLGGPIMKGLALLCYLGSLLSLASPSEDSELPTMVQRDTELPTMVHGDSEIPTMVQGDLKLPTMVQGDSKLPTMVQGDSELPTMVHGDSELTTMVNGDPELPTIAHRDPELPTMVHLPASASDISCNSAEKRRWEGWKVGPDRYYRSFGGQATQLWSEADRHGVSEHNLTRHPFSKA